MTLNATTSASQALRSRLVMDAVPFVLEHSVLGIYIGLVLVINIFSLMVISSLMGIFSPKVLTALVRLRAAFSIGFSRFDSRIILILA